MSVGDLYDVERTGEFAVTRVRQRSKQATTYDPASSVPITVLTDDATLADAIHDAAAANHPIATASTLDEASELAANGRCAVLITDQLSTQSALRQMTHRLREVEPALVVVAVGNTGDQNCLISLLSAGIVDRLMLKPVTPSLAQVVLKSAVQQHRTLQGVGRAVTLIEPQCPHPEPGVVLVELQRHAANDLTEAKLDLHPSPAEVVAPASMVGPAAPSRRKDIPRPPWIAVVAALLAVAGLMWWIAAERQPTIDPQAVVTANLAAAQRAFREGHALEPRGRSALDYYNTVLALDPTNTTAHQGIDQIADRLAIEAGMAIARGQVAVAIVALDGIRRVRPEHRRLQELQAQLAAAQETLAANRPERVAAEPQAPKAAPSPTLNPALQQRVEAQARAVAEAAAALKRDQQELAKAQQQFAARIEAAEAQLAAAREEQEVVESLPAAAPVPAVAAPATPTPRLARMVRPEYPSEALRTRAEGWVNVSLSVTPAGNVVDPRVEQSSNGTLFNRAALAAVRKWRYEPFASTDPLASQRMMVRVEFRMEERR
jgi:periplasmic protein TonB